MFKALYLQKEADAFSAALAELDESGVQTPAKGGPKVEIASWSSMSAFWRRTPRAL